MTTSADFSLQRQEALSKQWKTSNPNSRIMPAISAKQAAAAPEEEAPAAPAQPDPPSAALTLAKAVQAYGPGFPGDLDAASRDRVRAIVCPDSVSFRQAALASAGSAAVAGVVVYYGTRRWSR